MSVESLKSLFDVAAVVLLFLTFAAGAGVLITGNIISGRQEEKLRRFDSDLTAAKTALAIQQERAANADARANGADARIAEAQRGSAEANERAVQAEARVAEAKLELAKLRDPRRLLPEQQDRIIAELKKFAGQKFSFNVYPDPEPLAFLRIIDALLKSAGWERVPSQMGIIEVDAAGSTAGTAYDSGVDALIAPGAGELVPALEAFASAFSKAGIPCTPHTNNGLIGKTPKAILINVGKKP